MLMAMASPRLHYRRRGFEDEEEVFRIDVRACACALANAFAFDFSRGRQTDVPGMSGSHTTFGLFSLNFSSVQPFLRDTSQQDSPGWIQ
jgi:hypothetical protein